MRIVMVLAGCALLGCASGRSHGGGGGDDDAGVPDGAVVHVEGTLTLDPPVTTVTVENGVPVTVPFTATLTALDGTTKDVTADTRFQIDPVCCEFTGNKLTIHGAIKTKVVAAYADKAAFGDLTARLRTIRVDTSVPANAPDLFDHPDIAGLAPAIVYPPADPVMPRNLGDFEVHWTDANALDVFEVSLHTELADVKLYVRGDVGATGSGTNPRWSKFSAKEWLDTVGNASAVTLRVRGVNTAAPGTVGGGAPRTALLSNEVMDGGLYYWATATGIGSNAIALGVYRHDMKKPGERAEEFVTTTQTGGRCVACHVLSRDGKKMAITYQDPSANGTDPPPPPGPAAMVEVESRTIVDKSQRWQFATFTPDNAQLLSVDNGVLVVRDTTTQAVLATMPIDTAGVRVAQPDLSPDGTKLVYVRYQAPDPIISFVNGRIYTRTYNAATRAFGPEVPLVTTTGNNFYPSWSPDGAWVLYNHAAGSSSYDNNASTTWVIKAEGGTPVQLTLASQALATDAWPRWAPFGQTLGEAKEKMFWVTLSSKRDFGVRLKNPPQQRAKRAQIWMTPMFPGRAALGQDPSAPAFRLPFQNLDSSNHIAQWTERVVVVIQ